MEKYEFIKNLNESSMYRTKQVIEKTSAVDMANFAFMNLIALYILSFESEHEKAVKSYARRTSMFGNFKQYKQSGNDMYVALHSLMHGEHSCKDYDINQYKLKQFFLSLSQGRKISSPFSFFMLMERQLNIKNSEYKSVRRMAQDWPKLNILQQKFVIARIVKFFRSKAMRAELYSMIKDMATTHRISTKSQSDNKINDRDNKAKAKLAIAAAAAAGGAFVLGKEWGKSLV